jgi:hypothetical protein
VDDLDETARRILGRSGCVTIVMPAELRRIVVENLRMAIQLDEGLLGAMYGGPVRRAVSEVSGGEVMPCKSPQKSLGKACTVGANSGRPTLPL